MKKLISLLFIFLLLPFAVAEVTQEEYAATSHIAGELPGTVWYQLDLLFDSIKIALASDKVKARFEVMEERIAEMKVMIDNNRDALAVEAKNKIVKLSIDIQYDVSTKSEDIKRATQKQFYKSILVLEAVKERVPEQAKQVIENVIQHQEEQFQLINTKRELKEDIDQQKIDFSNEIRKEEIVKEQEVADAVIENPERIECEKRGRTWLTCPRVCPEEQKICIDVCGKPTCVDKIERRDLCIQTGGKHVGELCKCPDGLNFDTMKGCVIPHGTICLQVVGKLCDANGNEKSYSNGCEQTDLIKMGYNECALPGSDKDEHGCIPSAGYSWCEVKQKCIRSWEETCANLNKNSNCPGQVCFESVIDPITCKCMQYNYRVNSGSLNSMFSIYGGLP